MLNRTATLISLKFAEKVSADTQPAEQAAA